MASFDTSLTREEEGISSQLPGDGKYGTGPLVVSFETQGNGSMLLQSRNGSSCSPLGFCWSSLDDKSRSTLFVLPTWPSLTSFCQSHRDGYVASLTPNNVKFLTYTSPPLILPHWGQGSILLLLGYGGIPGPHGLFTPKGQRVHYQLAGMIPGSLPGLV